MAKPSRWAVAADYLVKTVIPIVVALIVAGTFRSCVHVGNWYKQTLDAPWQQGAEPFAVMKDSNGIVHFRGSIEHRANAAFADRLLQLPNEYRPAGFVNGAIVGSQSGVPSCALGIDKDGVVTISGCGSAYVWVDGFSYASKDSPIEP